MGKAHATAFFLPRGKDRGVLDQRALAALRAVSLRCSGVSFLFLAIAPMRATSEIVSSFFAMPNIYTPLLAGTQVKSCDPCGKLSAPNPPQNEKSRDSRGFQAMGVTTEMLGSAHDSELTTQDQLSNAGGTSILRTRRSECSDSCR